MIKAKHNLYIWGSGYDGELIYEENKKNKYNEPKLVEKVSSYDIK